MREFFHSKAKFIVHTTFGAIFTEKKYRLVFSSTSNKTWRHWLQDMLTVPRKFCEKVSLIKKVLLLSTITVKAYDSEFSRCLRNPIAKKHTCLQ